MTSLPETPNDSLDRSLTPAINPLGKTPKDYLEEHKRANFPRLSKEGYADKLDLERSTYFRLQEGKPVRETTYQNASERTGIPIELLKPKHKPTD